MNGHSIRASYLTPTWSGYAREVLLLLTLLAPVSQILTLAAYLPSLVNQSSCSPAMAPELPYTPGEFMSEEDLKAELERLRNENASLKRGASSGIRMKVSEKGAVSIYGMGRFPVTLYKEQWLKLLDMSPEIRNFIAENDARLKTKE